ncbi:MAG: 50S ribosomal protein L17 [Rickettsiales bacterium]|nr:50S ribosomal protein L17 [Rickettsiales bacterium]MCA0253991.1 50S ribosomal protein L17 [Pseudomonadota bacterium]
MRHKLKGTKLNRTSSHRKAMFANMATALIMNEQIKTTVVKAKALRPIVEKLVSKARKGTLAARRDIISRIKDKVAAEKLMSVLASRYKERPGGYTRVIKAGFRYGDMAPIAYIEFVERDINAKGCMTPAIVQEIVQE